MTKVSIFNDSSIQHEGVLDVDRHLHPALHVPLLDHHARLRVRLAVDQNSFYTVTQIPKLAFLINRVLYKTDYFTETVSFGRDIIFGKNILFWPII